MKRNQWLAVIAVIVMIAGVFVYFNLKNRVEIPESIHEMLIDGYEVKEREYVTAFRDGGDMLFVLGYDSSVYESQWEHLKQFNVLQLDTNRIETLRSMVLPQFKNKVTVEELLRIPDSAIHVFMLENNAYAYFIPLPNFQIAVIIGQIK